MATPCPREARLPPTSSRRCSRRRSSWRTGCAAPWLLLAGFRLVLPPCRGQDQPGGERRGQDVRVHHQVVVGGQLLAEAVEPAQVPPPLAVRLIDSLPRLGLAHPGFADQSLRPHGWRAGDEHAEEPAGAGERDARAMRDYNYIPFLFR